MGGQRSVEGDDAPDGSQLRPAADTTSSAFVRLGDLGEGTGGHLGSGVQ